MNRLQVLTKMYNKFMSENKVPENWKMRIILPIFKGI